MKRPVAAQTSGGGQDGSPLLTSCLVLDVRRIILVRRLALHVHLHLVVGGLLVGLLVELGVADLFLVLLLGRGLLLLQFGLRRLFRRAVFRVGLGIGVTLLHQ